jgi:hypothetical protein
MRFPSSPKFAPAPHGFASPHTPSPAPSHPQATAMQYLHSQAVIHGDLKASNVLLKTGPPAGGRAGGRARTALLCGRAGL